MRKTLIALSFTISLAGCATADDVKPEGPSEDQLADHGHGDEGLGDENLGESSQQLVSCGDGWYRHRVNVSNAAVRGISPCSSATQVATIPDGTGVCHAHFGWITCPDGNVWASTMIDGWGGNGPWQVRVGALTAH
jgi:hypothetical protein